MTSPTSSPTDGGPAYSRIADVLRERVEAMDPHTPLPSEREISDEFGVSRMTARHAVSVLESEGVVYRRPPRGTFVAEPRVVFEVGSFTEQVERQGRLPRAEVLDAETLPATRVQAEHLRIAEGELVHALRRLRLVDGVPVAIERTFIPAAVAPDLLVSPLEGSIWGLLRDSSGIELAEATALLESRPLDTESSLLLQVRSGAPGILLTRTTSDRSGRRVEFAVDTYRADRAIFEITQQLGAGGAATE